jgi:hypothetical protein
LATELSGGYEERGRKFQRETCTLSMESMSYFFFSPSVSRIFIYSRNSEKDGSLVLSKYRFGLTAGLILLFKHAGKFSLFIRVHEQSYDSSQVEKNIEREDLNP